MPTFLFCQAFLEAQDAGVSVYDPGVLRAVRGGALFLVLLGATSIAVGSLLRRTSGAVAVLFAVLLVLPGLVLLLPSPWDDDVMKFLPGAAGQAMSAVVPFPSLLSPLNGLPVLLAYTAAGILAAALSPRSRDS